MTKVVTALIFPNKKRGLKKRSLFCIVNLFVPSLSLSRHSVFPVITVTRKTYPLALAPLWNSPSTKRNVKSPRRKVKMSFDGGKFEKVS